MAKLGKWLSVVLCPLLGTQKSYLKNSTDLTNKLKNFTLEENLQWSLKKRTNYLFDIPLIESDFHLIFSAYRKPTHSNRYLNFHSCHPISVKRGVMIALVDRAFRFFFQEFLDSELLYLIVTRLNYKIIRSRHNKHNNRVIGVSQCTELNMPKSFISLPYVPILGEMLRRILRKHNIDTCFRSVRSLDSFLNSGKDFSRGDLVSGVCKILCSCGKF